MVVRRASAPTIIFVFGSNLAGVHGAGAAKAAHAYHGVEMGVGVGRSGNSYAIPTKDRKIKTLPLTDIARHVRDFLQYARDNPDLMFNVTCVGCGLAGYKDADIAPMFRGAPVNCHLPDGWR